MKIVALINKTVPHKIKTERSDISKISIPQNDISRTLVRQEPTRYMSTLRGRGAFSENSIDSERLNEMKSLDVSSQMDREDVSQLPSLIDICVAIRHQANALVDSVLSNDHNNQVMTFCKF